jgi:hypothetical protein
VSHLTCRLVEEGRTNPTGHVACALTGLMSNTYFPQGDKSSGMAQIHRTLTFLTKDPMAAHVFYSNLAQHISVKSTVKLLCMLIKCLNSAIQTEQKLGASSSNSDKNQMKRRRLGKSTGADEDADDDDSNDDDQQTDAENGPDSSSLSASNTTLMASIAETINALWQSVDSKLCLPVNVSCHEFLIEKFSGESLMVVLDHFERKGRLAIMQGSDAAAFIQEDCQRICAAILRCAGRLPSDAVQGLVPHISDALAKLGDTDGSKLSTRQATSFIALLCLWNMTEQVAKSLATSIESSFERDHSLNYEHPSPSKHSRKRRTGRPSKTSVDQLLVPQLPPLVAMQVLGDILSGSNPSSVAARESIFESPVAVAAIDKSLQRGIRYAELVLAGTTVSSLVDLPCSCRRRPRSFAHACLISFEAVGCSHRRRVGYHSPDVRDVWALCSPQAGRAPGRGNGGE